MKKLPALLLSLPLLCVPAHAAVLFADTFDRANSRNIDASLTGITDNTGSALPADDVYTHAWIDPASQEPLYGVQDGNAANGGGTQILGNQYQLKVGPGTVATYVNHNFTNSLITTTGGFSVSMDVTGYNQTTANQGAAFGIGMTAAEAASMRDAVGNSANETHMSNAFGATLPGQTNAVADFWLAIRGNNTLVWGNRDTILGSQTVAAKTGNISASFWTGSFNAGSNVVFEVFYNGSSQGTGSFQWSDTNANFIGLDGRDNTSVNLDNFTVATVPEPATAGLGLLGLGVLLRRRRR